MPRSLVLGNGSLLATFDEHLQMRDFYFPYVGEEDHTTYGKMHRVGFLVEGKGFSWLSDGTWDITIGYTDASLLSSSTLVNKQLAIEITCEDFVDPIKNILVRSFQLRTTDGIERKVQCFFHHDFYMYGDKQKDTAFFEPHTKSVIHYRQYRYFLVGGTTSDPVNCQSSDIPDQFHPLGRDEKHIDHCGITSFSIGKANYRGLEGTWKDAEDGVLSRFPIEQGSVDSTVEIDCIARPDRGAWVYLWVCAGEKISEVHALQHFLLEETAEQVKQAAKNFWRGWVHAHHQLSDGVAKEIRHMYDRSLLTIRTQTDNHGGILAATDNDIMQFNRDTYTYVWPRDGAFVSMALTRVGQNELPRRFMEFCAKAQTDEGYLLHKYNPDGSAGSSWHPWYRGRQSVLPIQGDETALPLVALHRHFLATKDFEFLHAMYQTFVRNAANFLLEYTEKETGLPLWSYDPWEEHRGIFSYTTATTVAGLRAASEMAGVLGHYRHADRYREAADRMCEALLFHLYDEQTACFMKKIKREGGKTIERDTTPDASIALLWQFGILPPDDPRMVSTMQRLERALTVQTSVGGIARYINDYYQSVTPPTKDIPGNPWIITTLWFTQWRIALAKTSEDLRRPALDLLWAASKASQSGMLPEQMDPLTGAPLSVAPLTWSHAVYMETAVLFSEAVRLLGVPS
jgi:GH15 family glucan-1,4-alpha-glucosidase